MKETEKEEKNENLLKKFLSSKKNLNFGFLYLTSLKNSKEEYETILSSNFYEKSNSLIKTENEEKNDFLIKNLKSELSLKSEKHERIDIYIKNEKINISHKSKNPEVYLKNVKSEISKNEKNEKKDKKDILQTNEKNNKIDILIKNENMGILIKNEKTEKKEKLDIFQKNEKNEKMNSLIKHRNYSFKQSLLNLNITSNIESEEAKEIFKNSKIKEFFESEIEIKKKENFKKKNEIENFGNFFIQKKKILFQDPIILCKKNLDLERKKDFLIFEDKKNSFQNIKNNFDEMEMNNLKNENIFFVNAKNNIKKKKYF